jgi:hypothetical protein
MADRLEEIKARLEAWQEEPCSSVGQPMNWPAKSGGCWFCDSKIADAEEDPIAALSRPFIVCVECGNKRCPKARWHHNECTASNASKQVCAYPEPFTPEDVAWLLAQLEQARKTNTRLNRRATKAEAFVGKSLGEMRAKGPVSFGRALANLAAEMADERARKAEARVAELEAAQDPTPTRARCTFEWRCQDCTDCGTGENMADVQAKALVHHEAMRAFTHRVQVCGWNGWTRP